AIVGLIALTIQRQIQAEAVVKVESAPEPAGEFHGSFWIFAAFASGFVTISTQVAWTRVLTMIIGSSTYAFSLVVALFLIGLAGGAWFIGRKDQSHNLRSTILVV